MKRKIVAAIAGLLVLSLLITAAYWVLIQSPHNEPPSEVNPAAASPTASPTPTPSPTPAPTPPPAPGVASINFRQGHLSEDGTNKIVIAYPTNNAVVPTGNLSLQIYAASKSASWSINSIWYTADWLPDARQCFSNMNLFTDDVEVTINFTDIPAGAHTVTAYLSVHDYSKANTTVCFTVAPQ